MLVGHVDTVHPMDNKSIYLFSDDSGPFIQIWRVYHERGDMAEQMLYVSPMVVSTTELMCDEAHEHVFM